MDWREPILAELKKSFDSEKEYTNTELARLEKAASKLRYCAEGQELCNAILQKRTEIQKKIQSCISLVQNSDNIRELKDAHRFLWFYQDVSEEIPEVVDRCSARIKELERLKEIRTRKRIKAFRTVAGVAGIVLVLLVVVYSVKINQRNKQYISDIVEFYGQGQYEEAYQTMLKSISVAKRSEQVDVEKFVGDYLQNIVDAEGYPAALQKCMDMEAHGLISKWDDIDKQFRAEMIHFVENADTKHIEEAGVLAELLIENQVIDENGKTSQLVAGNAWCLSVINKAKSGEYQQAEDMIREASENGKFHDIRIKPDYALNMVYQVANAGYAEVLPEEIRIDLNVAKYVQTMDEYIYSGYVEDKNYFDSQKINADKIIALCVRETKQGDPKNNTVYAVSGLADMFRSKLWSGYSEPETVSEKVQEIRDREEHYEVYLLPKQQMMLAEKYRAADFEESTTWMVKGSTYYQEGIYIVDMNAESSSGNFDNKKRSASKSVRYFPTFTNLETVVFWTPDNPNVQFLSASCFYPSEKVINSLSEEEKQENPTPDTLKKFFGRDFPYRYNEKENSLSLLYEWNSLLTGDDSMDAVMLGEADIEWLNQAYQDVTATFADDGETE